MANIKWTYKNWVSGVLLHKIAKKIFSLQFLQKPNHNKKKGVGNIQMKINHEILTVEAEGWVQGIHVIKSFYFCKCLQFCIIKKF